MGRDVFVGLRIGVGTTGRVRRGMVDGWMDGCTVVGGGGFYAGNRRS